MSPPDRVLVKAPQSRRGRGVSTVHLEPASRWGGGEGRVYVKRQSGYYCRPPWRGFRRTPTLRRELRGLAACRNLGIPAPRVVSYRQWNGDAELVLAEVEGLPLDQALERCSAAERAAIVGNVASLIGRLHRAGWTHGALYPHHILVGAAPDHRVAFIDLEKARRNPLRRRSDLARFWRHDRQLQPDERALFQRRYRSALRLGQGMSRIHSVTNSRD